MTAESWAETTVVNLLAGRRPAQALDFVLAYSERRTSSWADAALHAAAKAASGAHTAQARGQFRHVYGETAMKQAAQDVKAGCLPMISRPPGGAFMVTRVGRFGLSALTLRHRDMMPRRAVTRTILSARNHDIDPQRDLVLGDRSPKVTDLAYFGCMVATPCKSDHSVPAELLWAVPDAALSRWLVQMPLHRLLALLQNRVGSAGSVVGSDDDTLEADDGEIEDRAFSTFRLPKQDDAANDDENHGD